MTSIWLSIAGVVALIVVEALFVAAEIALVSLREQQVRALADSGRRGARVARLVSNPNRFLAAVQLGVTLSALLSSAFGAVTLSAAARRALLRAGWEHGWATVVSFVGVTLLITAVTLVIGELAPKRLALQRAEAVAQWSAPTLDRIAGLSRPVIWLLSKATDGVVRLFGGDPSATREAITEEELRGLVAAHEALTSDERQLIDEVFAAGERAIREVMVPRTEVQFLDGALTVTRALRNVAGAPHSRYPVIRSGADEIIGFVHVRDLLVSANGRAGAAAKTARVADVAREVTLLPATKKVLPAMSEMRRAGQHLAIVVDEYGGTAGIVTLEDLIEEVIGDIRDEYDTEDAEVRQLSGGDIEVDGLLNLDDFANRTGVRLPDGPYETVAGFVVARLGHLPRLGEAVEVTSAHGAGRVVRLTVSTLDGRRAERLRVTPLAVADRVPERSGT